MIDTSNPGEIVYYHGPALRLAHNTYETIYGHYLIRDTSRFGLVMTPSGYEHGDTSEFDYFVSWEQFMERPTEPRR